MMEKVVGERTDYDECLACQWLNPKR